MYFSKKQRSPHPHHIIAHYTNENSSVIVSQSRIAYWELNFTSFALQLNEADKSGKGKQKFVACDKFQTFCNYILCMVYITDPATNKWFSVDLPKDFNFTSHGMQTFYYNAFLYPYWKLWIFFSPLIRADLSANIKFTFNYILYWMQILLIFKLVIAS